MSEKVTRQDMEFTQPRTLKELLVEELHSANCDNYQQGKPVQRLDDESIKQLLDRIYEHIEKQALAVYHTTEPWALKAWAYSNILKDIIASEDSDGMVSELMSPVFDWQAGQDFDPITHYRERLGIEGKVPKTIQTYMETAGRIVSVLGRKRNYTDDEVIEYLKYAKKRYPHPTSYHLECVRVVGFLRRLPGADKDRKLPIPMPKMPTEFYQPTLSEQEIETLIWSTIIQNLEPDIVVRLVVASVYGGRRTELAELSSNDIYLDGDNSTIFIRTAKGGQRKPQPIPRGLVPLFAAPIEPMPGHRLQRHLRKICKKAGVDLPKGGGFHSSRRRVVTDVSKVEPSDINTSNFMRWAIPRGLTMVARYRQTPVEATDRAILEKHPYVKIWEQACPHILYLNTHYSSLYDNIQ